MVNKKNLFYILLLVIIAIPAVTHAVTYTAMAEKLKVALLSIGLSVIVIGWVVAGLLYLTAAGSPEKIGTAKKALIAAIIGTIVVLLASGAAEVIGTLFGIGGAT